MKYIECFPKPLLRVLLGYLKMQNLTSLVCSFWVPCIITRYKWWDPILLALWVCLALWTLALWMMSTVHAHIGTSSAGGSHLRRECQVISAASPERWCTWLRVSKI